jgi:CubicO group peptidase (beta-lactamase class C family)
VKVKGWRAAVVMLSVLASTSICQAQDRVSGATLARMDQVAQSFVAAGTFSGSVLVARGNDVVFSKGYGLASVERKTPNSPETRYRIASITKQFTAASILLLEERGRLSLDDQIKKYLPSVPAAWDEITIFHLLTHTAGFAGLQTPLNARGTPLVNSEGTLAGYARRLGERPLLSRPGETFSYTNAGYWILGLLIETISGQGYEPFVRENLLAPVGLANTGLYAQVPADTLATLSATPGGPPVPPANTLAHPDSAAGFYSTTGDLARWQTALYGGKVLSAASLKKMTTMFKGDYGLGIYLRTIDGRRTMTHGGGVPTFANLTYFPDQGISVVVLGNLNTTPAPEIAAFLGALAHGASVQLASERKSITLAPQVLQRYVGMYQMGGGTMQIVSDGGQLALSSNGMLTPLLAESETSFFLQGTNLRFEFVRDANGVVTEMLLQQGTRSDRATRVP